MKFRSVLFIPFLVLASTQLASGQNMDRYNLVPSPVYRQHEDVRRYNASPNKFGYLAPPPVRHQKQSTRVNPEGACEPVVKLRTEIVSQYCQDAVTYDSCGRRICRQMLVTIFKDVYSDGRSCLWHHVAY